MTYNAYGSFTVSYVDGEGYVEGAGADYDLKLYGECNFIAHVGCCACTAFVADLL